MTGCTENALSPVSAAVAAAKTPSAPARRRLAARLAASWELVLGGTVLGVVVAGALFAPWLTS